MLVLKNLCGVVWDVTRWFLWLMFWTGLVAIGAALLVQHSAHAKGGGAKGANYMIVVSPTSKTAAPVAHALPAGHIPPPGCCAEHASEQVDWHALPEAAPKPWPSHPVSAENNVVLGDRTLLRNVMPGGASRAPVARPIIPDHLQMEAEGAAAGEKQYQEWRRTRP